MCSIFFRVPSMIVSLFITILISSVSKICSKNALSSSYLIQQLSAGLLQQSNSPETAVSFGKTENTKNDIYQDLDETKVQFKTYDPKVFKSLREIAGICEKQYLENVCKENVDCLTNTDSKSGQLFWKTKDGKLLIKTIKHYECKTLRRILPAYHDHIVRSSPSHCPSLLNNLLGLYRFKLSSGQTKYCLICKNIYPEELTISSGYVSAYEQYDLKGSLVGRKKASHSKVYKDQDFIQQKHPFALGQANRKVFFEQLERDCAFLRDHHLMDYSLLVFAETLHCPVAVNNNNGSDNVELEWQELVKLRLLLPADALPWPQDHHHHSDNHSDELASIDTLTLSHATHDKGKIVCLGKDHRIYHFGIVDFLQTYSLRKHAETWLKSILWNTRLISCVNPQFYATRMITFLKAYCT